MKPEPLPPLPSAVSALLDAERVANQPPPDAVRADLARRLGSLPPKSSPPPTPSGAVGPAAVAKAVALVILGGIAGSAITLAVRPAPKPSATQVVVEPPAVDTGAPVAAAPQPSSSDLAAPASAPPPAPPPSPPPAVATSDRALAHERALIETARAAVLRRDGVAALLAASDHQRQFPNGRLAEEREALAIQGLMLAGRADEADARAQQFRRRYPNGLLLPVVEAAVGQ
jgi:hypothetical protein